jgi:hypothetical protein
VVGSHVSQGYVQYRCIDGSKYTTRIVHQKSEATKVDHVYGKNSGRPLMSLNVAAKTPQKRLPRSTWRRTSLVLPWIEATNMHPRMTG